MRASSRHNEASACASAPARAPTAFTFTVTPRDTVPLCNFDFPMGACLSVDDQPLAVLEKARRCALSAYEWRPHARSQVLHPRFAETLARRVTR